MAEPANEHDAMNTANGLNLEQIKENAGAEEIHAKCVLGDLDPDGRYAEAKVADGVCDHLHINSWNGDVNLIFAETHTTEFGAEMTPKQARAMAGALEEAARKAEEQQNADIVLKNMGDANE